MKNQSILNIRLRDDATFANYYGSAAGELLATDAIQYLWGIKGSGKSHLLQALCHQQAGTQKQVVYLQNLTAHDPEIFSSLEAFSLICIDDIDLLMGIKEWEVALFHLINSVKDNGHRLLISACDPATRLACQLPDLGSRLRAMVALQTDQLNHDQKLAMLQQRANNRGFQLNAEVAKFILERSPRNMVHLIELLDRLDAETIKQQKLVTIPFVKKTLSL